MRFDEIAEPSRGMMFSDSAQRGSSFPHYNDYTDMILWGRTDSAWGYPPHRGADGLTRGINVTYIDGHTEYIQRQGHNTLGAFRTYEGYAFNYKQFWAVPDSHSWKLAPLQ